MIFFEGETPWSIPSNVVIPCATENEINEKQIKCIIKNGAKFIIEGSNMPLTGKAIAQVERNDVFFIPAIAANAGGVAVSHYERSQNSVYMSWSIDDVDEKLRELMNDIYKNIKKHSPKDQKSLKKGAHIFAFKRLFGACLNRGI